MIEMIKLNTTLWEYRKCVLLKKGTEIYYSKESCFISRSIKQYNVEYFTCKSYFLMVSC